jgi:hypothetical protein
MFISRARRPVAAGASKRASAVENVNARLDAWRAAMRGLDGLVVGSPERQEAEAELERIAKAFHAEEAQAFVRYAEEAYQGWNRPGFAQLGRRVLRADD